MKFTGDLVLYAATAVGFLVIAYYALVARWWKSPEGRHIMIWTVWVFACLLFVSSRVSNFMSPGMGDFVRVLVYGSGGWLLGWRGRLIARAQAEALRSGKARPSEIPPIDMANVEHRPPPPPIARRWARRRR